MGKAKGNHKNHKGSYEQDVRGLHRVPEDKRLTGQLCSISESRERRFCQRFFYPSKRLIKNVTLRMGRQISECSETSVTSTDAPTEKRLQDSIFIIPSCLSG